MELVSGVFSSWLMLAMKRVFVEFDTARPSASCCSSSVRARTVISRLSFARSS